MHILILNLVYFSVNLTMFPLFLRIRESKVLDPNGPYISTSHTKRGQIFDFRDSMFGRVKNIAICLKKISQK